MKTLGEKIKELREGRGLSLRGLSQKLDGLASAAHISDIERSRRNPSPELLSKLAAVFTVATEDLTKYDARPILKNLRRLADSDPSFGLQLKSVVENRISAPSRLAKEILQKAGDAAGGFAPQQEEVEIIIRLIASGLVDLQLKYERSGEPPRATYSKNLQRGFDRLVALCLLNGKTPPQSIPDLLRLCERTFAEWPFPQLPDDIHPRDALLSDYQPTYFCEDYARSERDIEAALSEERYMQKVFVACADLPADTYTALRSLLVTEPVLSERELIGHFTRAPLRAIADLVKEAYEEAPGYLAYKGTYLCCPECGNLLFHSREKGLLCRDESCGIERVRDERQARKISAKGDEGVYRLKHSLRRYVAAPGRVELKLKDKLEKIGCNGSNIKVDLWPNVDAYDLRLTFPNREVWALDVKDWASPYRLAAEVKPFRTDPPWDRAFFVFPDRYKVTRRNYAEAFRSRCIYLGDRVEAMFESDLIAAARHELREAV